MDNGFNFKVTVQLDDGDEVSFGVYKAPQFPREDHVLRLGDIHLRVVQIEHDLTAFGMEGVGLTVICRTANVTREDIEVMRERAGLKKMWDRI